MPFTGFWKEEEVSERLASRAQRSRCSASQSPVGTELNSAASLGSKKGREKPLAWKDPLGRGGSGLQS